MNDHPRRTIACHKDEIVRQNIAASMPNSADRGHEKPLCVRDRNNNFATNQAICWMMSGNRVHCPNKVL